MFEVGSTFDRFRIEAELGQGGMGKVYRAFDTRLERRVALKVLLLDASIDGATRGEAVARMLREARTAAALEHPNKVSVYDLGEVDELPFIAMEYIPGETLRAYVGTGQPTWQRKLNWLLAAAGALEAAHNAGIVHRDVKPENIMVRDDGVVKVLDFGIARRSGLAVAPMWTPASDDPALTQEGRLVGTPAYMSPEQIAGREIDGRADQFAWGVTVYEVLTGVLPWSTTNGALGMVAGMLTEAPTPLRARVPDLPRVVDEVIQRTLAKSARDRFGRISDVLDVLEPFAASARRVPVARETPNPTRTSSPGFSPRPGAAILPTEQALRTPSPPTPPAFHIPIPDPPPPRPTAPSNPDSGTRASAQSSPRVTGTRTMTSAGPLTFAVDPEERFRRFPEGYTVKGMFFSRVIGLGPRFAEAVRPKLVGPPRAGRYLPFSDYPQVDFSRIVHAVATGLYANAPVPEAMRLLARQDFATFAASAVGRVSLALMGDAKTAILKLPESYAAVLKGGVVTARTLGPDQYEMTFRDFYGWVDCYPLGNLEGLARHFGASCLVEASIVSAVNAVYRITLTAGLARPYSRNPCSIDPRESWSGTRSSRIRRFPSMERARSCSRCPATSPPSTRC